MSSALYLMVLSLATLFYLVVFVSSIYVWRLSNLRWVWVGVGGATLLIALQRFVTLLKVWSTIDVTTTYPWINLLDLIIPVFLMVAAALTVPAIKKFNARLEKTEETQRALAESEAKYRALIESTNSGYVITNSEGVVLECNDTYVKLTGRSHSDEVIGHNLAEWAVRGEDDGFVEEALIAHYDEELKQYDRLTYRHLDGSQIPIELFSRGLRTAEGFRIVALLRDVSEREAVRKQLEASEKQANLLFANSPISTAIFKPDGRFVRANKAHDRLWDIVISKADPNFNILKDDQANARIGKEKLAAIFRGEQIALQPFVYRGSEYYSQTEKGIVQGRDNTVLPMFFPLKDEQGELISIVQMHIDLSERVAAEQQLRERETFYRALVDSTNDAYALLKPDETVIDANAEYVRLTGHSDLTEIKDQVSRQWVSGDMGLAELHQLVEQGGKVHGVRCDYRHPDGTIIPAEVSASVVESATGPQVVILARDISERLESENRLRQVQKMDAIGKLTGGMAHDFNNLLGVVIGNAELALTNKAAQESIQRYLQAILDAAERGAALTHRLLAFSRQTPLAPRVVDINLTLSNACALLQRLIGEDVDLVLVKTKALPSCEVDPGELENVIINLANNARDAMPCGGKLTIEARSVACYLDNKIVMSGELTMGDYVVISVTDSGEGIAEDILHRVTDPFFTTKDVGKGTGLGLSMAYGFAKQSNGHLSIYSERGEGTTVNIYLPAHRDPAEAINVRPCRVSPRGNEKILLVEDDPALLVLARHMLVNLGYRVEVASDVAEGLELYRQHGDFDLLLTDMILPGGRNGRELAEELLRLNPDLQVLYMSGYTENAILHHGRLDQGVALLQKPFRSSDLSVALRQLLDV